MKKKFPISLLLISTYLFFTVNNLQAQVGIGTNSPNASSVLDLSSTSKGVLVPRMTAAQKAAISSPALGLLVYQSDDGPGFYFYDGSAWVKIATGSTSLTVGPLGTANANGASISSGVLSLTPADGTNPGIVSTGIQSFAGAKTFTSDINVNGATFGKGAGNKAGNTVLGFSSLLNNTTGNFNTASGYNSLLTNTTGSYNTAYGAGSLALNESGVGNTALGNNALSKNTSGSDNIATGYSSLEFNTTGATNIAYGSWALRNNSTGYSNTALGYKSLYMNISGNQNTAIGDSADVSGILTNATAIGYNAKVAASNSVQLGNTSVTEVKTSGIYTGSGFKTPTGTASQYLMANGTVSAGPSIFANDIRVNGLEIGKGLGNILTNTRLGVNTLASNTTGSSNTALGLNSLALNTTGSSNTASGYSSLGFNTEGYGNTASGANSLSNNTTGYNNTALGYYSLTTNTTGYGNTASGVTSLLSNTTGNYNTASGEQALLGNTTGSSNTALGYYSLVFNTTGTGNSAFGQSSLNNNTSGSYNTALGYGADVASGVLTNATAIGYYALATNSNSIQLGNSSVITVKSSGNIINLNPTSVAYNATTNTASAEAIIGGLITSDNAAARTITLPSAADIATALGGTVSRGTTLEFTVDNSTNGSGTVTLSLPASITAASPVYTNSGTNTTLNIYNGNDFGRFRLIFLNSTTAKLYRVF